MFASDTTTFERQVTAFLIWNKNKTHAKIKVLAMFRLGVGVRTIDFPNSLAKLDFV